MKRKNNNKKEHFCIGLICVFLIACNGADMTDGVFVSTKNNNDTLYMRLNGSYTRKVRGEDSVYVDKGTWFYAQNRIWLNDWVHRGEDTFNSFGHKVSSVSFSFDKNLIGNITRIYFDVITTTFIEDYCKCP